LVFFFLGSIVSVIFLIWGLCLASLGWFFSWHNFFVGPLFCESSSGVFVSFIFGFFFLCQFFLVSMFCESRLDFLV